MTTLFAVMAHGIAVALMTGGAAWVAERGLRGTGLPTRWVWLGALLLSAGLTLRPAIGAAGGPGAAEAVAGTLPRFGDVRQAPSASSAHPPATLARRAADGLEAVLAGVVGAAPARAAAPLALLWVVGTGGLTATLLLSAGRIGRLRRRWPRLELDGRRVRVSARTGPAVVGLRRPEIVLPRWVLSLAPSDLRLVLLHEGEHVASRDTALLGAGLAPLVLFAWNPVLWWQFARLRAAVEIDCDRRVLRAGASPVAYAEVLLRVGGSRLSDLDPVPTLGGSSSLLERRLKHMKSRTHRAAWPTGIVAASAAAGLLVLACEMDRPGPPPEGALADDEIAALDEAVRGAGGSRGPATGETGSGVPGATGAEEAGSGRVHTRAEETDAPSGGDDPSRPDTRTGGDSRTPPAPRTTPRPERIVLELEPPRAIWAHPDTTARGARPQQPPPLFIVDGVIVSGGLPGELDPSAIESIEVIKGAAAARLYGSRAASGVVQIRTKVPDGG